MSAIDTASTTPKGNGADLNSLHLVNHPDPEGTAP
jgi:hypothetical protein